MIKMKVYENWREYYSDPDAQRINQRYSENCWHMDGKPPFRDPESLRLMKETYNIEFAPGGWYSVIWGENRTHIGDVPADLAYALMLLQYSREGRFLSGEYLDSDKIWAVLSDMPFDILIFCTWRELWNCEKTFCKNTSFLILNYPLFGMIVEKNYGGTYRLSGDLFRDLTYNMEHGDILAKAVRKRRADGELIILFINVPNVLWSAEDLENTLWAARVYQDSIELFDKYDGMKLFAAAVREALASNNCEIS